MTDLPEGLPPQTLPSPLKRPRADRASLAARERRIVNSLVLGLNPTEIARNERVSLRRVQQMIRTIFARRRDAMPEHFLDLQITRLHEAFLVSYAAMGGGNLKAVDRVVRIVGELDRYYGFKTRERLAAHEGAKQIAAQPFDRIESRETGAPLVALASLQGATMTATKVSHQDPAPSPLDGGESEA